MGVSAERAIEDAYWPVQLTSVDERVVLDGWVYYVRAVKLRRDLYPGGRLAQDDAFAGLLDLGGISTWNDDKVQILYCEKLPDGV